MKSMLKYLLFGLGIFCLCLSVARYISATSSHFYLSVPLDSTTNVLRAQLPAGRYAVIVSTNCAFRQFSVVSSEHNYSEYVTLNVESNGMILLQGTNIRYMTFRVPKEAATGLKISVDVRKLDDKERLFLLIGRGF